MSERMIASLSVIDASWLKCSQICVPGTLVEIGLNSPRTSAVASGFMSNVSS